MATKKNQWEERLNDNVNDNGKEYIQQNKLILNVTTKNIYTKKAMQVYLEPELIKKLNNLSTRTQKNRNEIITLLIEFGLNNIEIKE